MRRALTWLGLLAFFLTLGFALQKNTNLRSVRFEVSKLERSIAEERSRLGVLRADYANLTRLTRLEQLAVKHFQELRVADPRQVRVLEAENAAEELRASVPPAPPPQEQALGQALTFELLR